MVDICRSLLIATAPRPYAWSRRPPLRTAPHPALQIVRRPFSVHSYLESANRHRRWIGFVYGTKPGRVRNVSSAVFRKKRT